jgi:hypothetical protein
VYAADMSRPRLVLSALSVAGFVVGCDVAAPPPPPPPEPVPGWALARPFPNIRALSDVDVYGSGVDGITAAYAVGTDGAILKYDGTQWSDESVDSGVDLEAVSVFVDGEGVETVLAVGAAGTVLARAQDDDGPGSWSIVASGVDKHLFGVWAANHEDAFIVGDDGTVLRYDGTTLTLLVEEVLIDTETVDPETGDPIFFPIADPLKSVQGRGPDDVWAVGPRGLAYRFNGTAFVRDLTNTNRPLADVFVEAGIWAAATDGVLLRRRDDGWSDSEFVAPAPVFLQGIWGRGDGDVFAIGMAEEIFHNENGAWNITFVEEASEFRALDGAELVRPADAPDDFVTQREVLVVGAGGRIVRGPLVLPRAGEVALTTRPAIDPDAE